MTIIFDLKAAPHPRVKSVPGACANCAKTVYEALVTLDDCYNVWAGKCPHCGAINMLGLNSLRGYSSSGMTLWLPTDEEKTANDLPVDCPARGPAKHGDKMIHGTVAGELYHQLGGAKEP